jgi:ADP-ribosylglycohydrolase
MGDMPRAAADSLKGLALGDGFGERWFFRGNHEAIAEIRVRRVPDEAIWHWTDDTVMALGIVSVLLGHGEVNPAALAYVFAANYQADPGRGYGAGMHELLPRLGDDPSLWSELAQDLFGGQGSLGNGSAMRAAPLGAWFAGDLDQVRRQARRSAEVTHAHPEGIAGAVAVATAAALATASRDGTAPEPGTFLREVAARTPAGAVRDGITRAAALGGGTAPWKAADVLGNGQRVTAADTVPFALWSASHHLDDLEAALWATAEGLGDVDTTCAITGGVVAARTGLAGIPAQWLELTEPLPAWATGDR